MKRLVRIGGVSERDLDLLLLEEFLSSSDFAHWFASAIRYDAALWCRVAGANRSVTNSTGESDLEVDFLGATGDIHKLLIENKVAAGFQPEQASRYRARGEGYLLNGAVKTYRTVLVAPSAYFAGDSKGFDARLNYEAIVDWCAHRQHSEPRYRYKIALLTSAIEKSTSGYQVIEDEVVSSFWRDYWTAVCEIAPDLDMPEPAAKPGGSSFVIFRTPALPKWMKLKHKLTHGNVDLEFRHQADNLPKLRQKLEGKLTDDMKLVRAAKSAAIRISVPTLDLTDDFLGQRDRAQEGILAVRRLQQWATALSEQFDLNAVVPK